MDRFRLMETFVKVAEVGGFSAAARSMRLSKAVVSKYISLLEEQLSVRLFNRTTRQIRLTEEGRDYLQRCKMILADLEEAERSVKDLHGAPSGLLRISAPMSFGIYHLSSAIADFMEMWPKIEIDLDMNDRFVDVLAEGFDLAIRGGKMVDSSLIARRLAPLQSVLCGSAAYFKEYGEPQTPDELVNHNCIGYSYSRSGDNWHFQSAKGDVVVSVKSKIRVNSGDAIRQIVLQGQGIAIIPTFLVGHDLAQGTLIKTMDNYPIKESGLYALYHHNRHLSAKVRVFVDFLAKRYGKKPYWDRNI
ncbi:MAG: LysR family transcriptional regulator [Magnetococcales bacterium]|nr:LysR family transcriptional regulator [Magnetococcales bacterium]